MYVCFLFVLVNVVCIFFHSLFLCLSNVLMLCDFISSHHFLLSHYFYIHDILSRCLFFSTFSLVFKRIKKQNTLNETCFTCVCYMCFYVVVFCFVMKKKSGESVIMFLCGRMWCCFGRELFFLLVKLNRKHFVFIFKTKAQ